MAQMRGQWFDTAIPAGCWRMLHICKNKPWKDLYLGEVQMVRPVRFCDTACSHCL